MGAFKDLKVYARSGSWQFVQDAKKPAPPGQVSEKVYVWKGMPIHYRPGTSDCGAIYEILLRQPEKTEYFIDPRVKPEIVLDIGANIGVTAIWLKHHYPNAEIYCFEPMPENFCLLEKNTKTLAGVKCFPFGLGAEDAICDIYANEDPNNFGGFSIHARQSNFESLGNTQKYKSKIEIKHAARTLERLGISGIDILKIDTEGAEYDIVSSLPNNLLENCQWIMGELHGIKTYGVLNILEPHFATQFKKTFTNELFTFFGMNRKLLKNTNDQVSRSC